MNKKIYAAILTCFFAFQLEAQQVEETQRTFVTKMTATWCPSCGSWGWSFFDNLLNDNSEQAVFMAVHHSGLLSTEVGKDIFSNFGATYQPQFFLDEEKLEVVSSNAAVKRTEAMQAIDLAFNTAPVANVGFAPVFTNNTLQVDARVKFFQQAEGEYYLGLYLVEDGVIEFQQSVGNNAVHKKVLRTGFTDESFGLPITNGSVSAGSEFDLTFTLEIGEIAGYDYEVTGIIWKKENNKYVPVNSWSTNNINDNPTATTEPSALFDFSVNPNITNDLAIINITLDSPVQNGALDLYDLNGRKVLNLASGSYATGTYNFEARKSMVSSSGVYLIRFTSEDGVKTKRVIFQ